MVLATIAQLISNGFCNLIVHTSENYSLISAKHKNSAICYLLGIEIMIENGTTSYNFLLQKGNNDELLRGDNLNSIEIDRELSNIFKICNEGG